MADDHLFNIKKFMDHVVWTPTWISNGHFAARKLTVKLGNHLTSDDAVICAFPNADGVGEWEDEKIVASLAGFTGVRVEFTRSPWRHENAALFLDDAGNAAWFNADYCDALKLHTLYGPAPMFSKAEERTTVAYFSAPALDDSAVVIMPMKVPVDWDQVARTVSAATSIEEPEAGSLHEMPESRSVAEALMDDLQNPDSEAAKTLAASVAGTGSTMTVSVNGRSATIEKGATE